MPAASATPYWRLSAFYGFYFASLGVLVPYWSPYLHSLGFRPAEIGELMATIMISRLVAPNIWGWIADRSGQRLRIVQLASLLGMITFLGVFVRQDYWWLALSMTLFSFFWNASLPQFEAITLAHLGRDTHRYSHIRLWGSVGFIVAVVGLGAALESQPQSIVPPTLLALFIGIWLVSLSVTERPAEAHNQQHRPLHQVLRQPAVLALLGACFLMQFSHGPYYTFYTIHMRAHGYGSGLVGGLWALGVLAEVGLFIVMHRLLRRYQLRDLFFASFILAGLRWLLIGFLIESVAILLFAQLLHAASFALYHAVAIQLIHQHFKGRNQGRGQALYSSLSFGAGGAAGTLLSGYTWEMSNGPALSYAWAAAACLIAVVLVRRWL